jgi:hypothetical protein
MFASEGDLVGTAAMALFHKIAQMKKGILLLLLLIMATLIESVDDMDEYTYQALMCSCKTRMKLLSQPRNVYIKKLSDDSLLSCWMEYHLQ